MRLVVLAFAVLLASSPLLVEAAPVLPKLTSLRASLRSADGRCTATVLYPHVSGLADPRVEASVNRFLESRWKAAASRDFRGASLPCQTAYLASIGFDARVHSNGILSVKRTRALLRGGGLAGNVESECHLIDLKRGGRIEIARWLGPSGLARLSSLTQDALQERYRTRDLRSAGFTFKAVKLAAGNFTACLEDDAILVQLGPAAMAEQGRGAVEARIPFEALRGHTQGAPIAKLVPALGPRAGH